MVRKISEVARCGLAVALTTTLMVPATAIAEPGNGVDARDDAPASDAGTRDDDASGAADELGNEKVTIIVQLDEGSQGTTPFSYLLGRASQDRHSFYKDQIRGLAAEAVAGDSAGSDEEGARALSLFSATPEGAGDGEDEGGASVDELHDYYHVIDGFAVKAPASTLAGIKALDGVKNAFIEHEYAIPADQEDAGAPLKNQASLDITEADKVSQKGDGQVIAIIDTGIDTDHEAFSGDLDDSTVALTEDKVADAKKGMTSGGQNGTYLSEKIPFAYDYADGDAEVNPSAISGMEHGTHVAGIASANGGDQIRGTAPNAQIAVMKVASDANGGIYDSALIAAMDDLPKLGVSSVNISIGADSGFSDEGAGTYTDAINALEKDGITVNVAAGNSYSAAVNNQSGKNLPYATDPDSSIVSTPATVSGSFAVASMNVDKTEVDADSGATGSLTVSDGTKMDYWEAKGPNGEARPNKFADLADGSYPVVWGDSGRTTGSGNYYGDVDPNTPNSLEGKIVLIHGHQDLFGFGDKIEYARSLQAMSQLGAAAVIFYDPELSETDLADIRLDDGDYYDANSCPAIFVTPENGEALKAIDKSTRAVTKEAAAETDDQIVASDGTSMPVWEAKGPNGEVRVNRFSKVADGTYEYVWADMGREDIDGDVKGQRLDGKIALVKGHQEAYIAGNVVAYSRSVSYLSDLGAVAVIFYDPALTDDDYDNLRLGGGIDSVNGDWDTSNACPALFVKPDQGEALKDAATKTISVKHPASDKESVYQMSDFSSWGVTPDLKLKPEIAAPGGNVYSSILGGQYAYYSGTSMATPQISGIAALVHEYVSTDQKFSSLNGAQRANAVTQLLMSTATPMADATDLSSYYSPRHQGAGVANVPAALSSEVLASVDGAEDSSRPKADLGESADGTWSFTVTLDNRGAADHRFTLDAAALSEKVADGLFQLSSKNWTGAGIDISFGGSAYDADTNTVTVPAKGLASFTVSVAVGDEFKQFASENTPNGTFVDGYAFLKAADGGVDLSVPFLGFYGDWSKAPVFDNPADGTGDDAPHILGTTFIDPTTSREYGRNPLIENNGGDIDQDKMVMSDSGFYGAPNYLRSRTGLLRNVDNLTSEVFGPDGTSQGDSSWDYIRKSFWHQNAKAFVSAEDNMASPATFAPASSPDTPEGDYTFTMTGTTAGPTPERQSESFTVHYDKTAPEIENVVYHDNGDADDTITFTVRDNTYIAGIDLIAPGASVTPFTRFYRVLVDDSMLTSTEDDGTHVYSVTVSVPEAVAAWKSAYPDAEMPSTVDAYAWDYGLTASSRSTAVLLPVVATGLSLGADSATVAVGQQVPLTATLAPEDTTQTKVVWSSSDESVVTVSDEGVLSGVKEGTATVTATLADNPAISDTVSVTVASVSNDEGIVLSNDVLPVITDGSATVTALLSGSLAGKDVTWTSSNPEVFSVEAADGNSSQATVTGGYQVGDATLTATVDLGNGQVKTATATVQNRTAGYSDFIIDENHTLLGYRGAKTSIVIPNDVTSIADRAFEGNDQIVDVTVPASVVTIGERAFASIYHFDGTGAYTQGKAKAFTFEDSDEHPSQLVSIGDEAFADGGATGSVTLPRNVETIGTGLFKGSRSLSGSVVIPSKVRDIPNDTFSSSSVTDVTVSDKVERIGANASNGTLFFTTLKLTDTEPGAATTGLPSHLTELGEAAFAGSYFADDVVVPAGVKRIEPGTFSTDRFIQHVTLNEGLEYIGASAFQGTSITEITLPDSLVHVDDKVFTDAQQLQKVTLGRNLAADDLANTFSWNFALSQVVVPDDAVNYTSKNGAVYSKDLSKLVYYPSALTGEGGTLSIPEGVTTIMTGAFNDSALSSVVIPSSVAEVQKSAISKQLDVVDFGAGVTSIAQDAFRQDFYANSSGNAGYTPKHLIVRGGADGSYADTGNAAADETAYFGPGMSSLDFSLSGAPGTLVVPGDAKTINLSGNAGNPGDVTVYAPEGSDGWKVASAALEAIGADPKSQLKPYVELSSQATLAGIPAPGAAVPVEAQAVGGVDGDKSFRFVQLGTDGAETVLQDWSADATYDWEIPADGATLRVDVRDRMYLTASSIFGPQAPVITSDLPTAPTTVMMGDPTPTLSVGASSPDGADVTYQWYKDGAPIDGATGSSYNPGSAESGTHEYYVVVSAAKDGLVSSTKSSVATVKVVSAAVAPVITVDLPASLRVDVGDSVALSVEAKGAGTLTYQWYLDGKAIPGATSSTYRPGTTAEGEHEYYVVVTSTVGLSGNSASATSSTARVIVGGEERPAPSFSDVSKGAWYYQSVTDAAALGYINGYAGTDLFGPTDTLTRGQAAVILRNMVKGSGGAGVGSFSDVDPDAYYAESVAWVKAAGVMNGYEGTDLFGPEDPLTREQVAAVLFNYARQVDGVDVSVADIDAALGAYPDANAVSDWAREAVAWAVEHEVMGNGESLSAQDAITRAEVAAMAVNYQPKAKE